MKNKKITKLISKTESNLKSIADQMSEEFAQMQEDTVKRDLEKFDQHEVEEKVQEPVEEPDLIEHLSSKIMKELNAETHNLIEEMTKSISDETLTEMALELFGDDPEINHQEVVETVEEQFKNPERLVLDEEVVQQMDDGAMKSYLETMSKMKPVPVVEKTDLMGGAGDPVTQAQLNAATSQMMSKIQTALGSLGGGGLGDADIAKMINIEIGKLDSELTGNIGNLDSDLSSSLDSVNFILNLSIEKLDSDINQRFLDLTTDSVAEGDINLYYTKERVDSDFDTRFLTKNTDSLAEGVENLYYQDDRVELLVDSDYVMQRVSITTNLRFKGGVSVDVDAAPVSPENGDIYINDSDCVAGASWTGISGVTVKEAFALGWAEDAGRWYVIGDANIDVEQLKKDTENKTTPPGAISMWMGENSPDGYFLCRGGTFDHNRYPLLHAHLQASYSGYVTGTLPDFRGRFPGGDGGSGMSPLDGKTGRLFDQTTAEPSGSGLSVTADQNMTASSTASTTVNSTGSSHTHTASSSSSTSIGGGTVETQEAGNHRHRFGNAAKVDGKSSDGRMYHDPDNGTAQTGYAGAHKHTLDLSSITASTTTTTTVNDTNSSHTHGASTSVTTTLGNKDITVDVDGWDDYTRPYAFNINFIIKHDAE